MADERNGLEPDSYGGSGGEEEEWEEVDEESAPVKCLFCEEMFGEAEQVWHHCQSCHHFNLQRIICQHGLDFYGCIKLINFIRSKAPSPDLFVTVSVPFPWESDEFLRPVVSDDGLLQYDFEDMEDVSSERDQVQQEEHGTIPYSQYLEMKHRLKVAEERADRAEAQIMKASQDINQLRDIAQNLLLEDKSSCSRRNTSSGTEDEAYFSSYSHYSIHEEMLKDKTRTESYRDFIYGNPHIFKDKVVLDVGCGTGILCLFAARCGARCVIGIDQSEIIYQAMDIVRENGFEKIITLVKGRAEEVTLPVDKVDVIISEWMGYFLLFESMLDTVLLARDTWIRPGGSVYPDKCSISVVAIGSGTRAQHKVNYWDDVYGFKMSCMKRNVCKEAAVEVIDSSNIISSPCVIKDIDVNEIRLCDLNFDSTFNLKMLEDGECAALVAYFDIGFVKDCTKEVHFSTNPLCPPTHWKQTVFHLENTISVTAGQVLNGALSCKKNRRDRRSLDVIIRLVETTGTLHCEQTFVVQ